MSAPYRYAIVGLNTVSLLSQDHDQTDIGCAILIWAWLCRGRMDPKDVYLQRVSGLGDAEWASRKGSILLAVAALMEDSEPRARFGRPTLSRARKDAILTRDGAKCRYCKTTVGPFHIDHIKPLARGGSNRDENLCVACATCNFKKAAKLHSELGW